jgi:hypothetical protein
MAWWRSEQWRLLLSSLPLAKKNNERESRMESRKVSTRLFPSPRGASVGEVAS